MNKTSPDTSLTAEAFIATVENKVRKADALTLLGFMTRISGFEPVMWGKSLIGFGQYHYKYESGREGDAMRIGFSPRKANLVIYIMPGYQGFDENLSRLGKYKLGKSCLYINKLADIDLFVLEEICRESLDIMAHKYPV